jgi:hypothetical protein
MYWKLYLNSRKPSFEVCTTLKYGVEVFWDVTTSSVAVGYQRRWRQQGPPKLWYPNATLHGVTTRRPLLESRNVITSHALHIGHTLWNNFGVVCEYTIVKSFRQSSPHGSGNNSCPYSMSFKAYISVQSLLYSYSLQIGRLKYIATMLPLVLYGYQTWHLTQRHWFPKFV